MPPRSSLLAAPLAALLLLLAPLPLRAQEPVPPTAAGPDLPERQAIASYLVSALGEPYRRGALGEGGYDCSGLVVSAYAAAGRQLPRLAAEQLRQGQPVEPGALRPGDLLFYRFNSRRPQRLHVVIYIGGGRAIHASPKHGEVREIEIAQSIWTRRLVATVSLL
ncbi:MAG: C40 family peptidase [Stagnimonas sp.]|nr:C40 family peptidase [Stagnimonas sp.]